MKRGRKPQAPSVRAAKGNPGKRAPAKAAGGKNTKPGKPSFELTTKATSDAPAKATGRSDPAAAKVPGGTPRELTKAGRIVWNYIAPQLVHSTLYHPSYRLALTRYCDTIADYWIVTRKLRRTKFTYEAKKFGGGTMLRFHPLFMVQARHPLVSVRGATQSPLISASFSGVTLSPGAFPLGLPVSLSHRKSDTRVRFAGFVVDAVRADAPPLPW